MATTLLTKFVRHFYGYDGVWDEYKAQVVHRLGNRAFTWLVSYIVVSTGLAMVAAFQYENTFWTLMVLNILAVQIIAGHFLYGIKQAGIFDETITKDNLQHSRKVALRRWLFSEVQFTFTVYILQAFGDGLLDQRMMTATLVDRQVILASLLMGAIMGIITLFYRLITLKPTY